MNRLIRWRNVGKWLIGLMLAAAVLWVAPLVVNRTVAWWHARLHPIPATAQQQAAIVGSLVGFGWYQPYPPRPQADTSEPYILLDVMTGWPCADDPQQAKNHLTPIRCDDLDRGVRDNALNTMNAAIPYKLRAELIEVNQAPLVMTSIPSARVRLAHGLKLRPSMLSIDEWPARMDERFPRIWTIMRVSRAALSQDGRAAVILVVTQCKRCGNPGGTGMVHYLLRKGGRWMQQTYSVLWLQQVGFPNCDVRSPCHGGDSNVVF